MPEVGSQVSILGLRIADQAGEVRKRIGVALQSTSLFERLTLVELLRFYAACYNRRMSAADALKLLARFRLAVTGAWRLKSRLHQAKSACAD